MMVIHKHPCRVMMGMTVIKMLKFVHRPKYSMGIPTTYVLSEHLC